MRGTRKKLLTGTGKARRAVKDQYKADIRAKAGWSTAEPSHRRGLKGAKPAPYANAWSFRRAHPLHQVGRPDVFRELTHSGQKRALALKHGGASRMSRPAIDREIRAILATRGVSQIGRI